MILPRARRRTNKLVDAITRWVTYLRRQKTYRPEQCWTFDTERRSKTKHKIWGEERDYILRDLDGEINGRTVMVNKALNHLRSFFESMTSDIEKMSRCLIVGKQQVLYPRQRRYHGTYVSVYIFSCFVYGFFHLLCSELRALVGCYHYPCRCPV